MYIDIIDPDWVMLCRGSKSLTNHRVVFEVVDWDLAWMGFSDRLRGYSIISTCPKGIMLPLHVTTISYIHIDIQMSTNDIKFTFEELSRKSSMIYVLSKSIFYCRRIQNVIINRLVWNIFELFKGDLIRTLSKLPFRNHDKIKRHQLSVQLMLLLVLILWIHFIHKNDIAFCFLKWNVIIDRLVLICEHAHELVG